MEINFAEDFSEQRNNALDLYDLHQIYSEILQQEIDVDLSLLDSVSLVLEVEIISLIPHQNEFDERKLELLRKYAAEAFRINRILPQPEEPLHCARHLLKMASLAVLGDRGADISRILKTEGWPQLPINSDDWHDRTWSTIVDVWLRLIRKNGWEDRDIVLKRIAELREHQNQYERNYLDSVETQSGKKAAALELIGLYHLARAAEIFARFITDGVVDGDYQIKYLLEAQFEKALKPCKHAMLVDLQLMTPLLRASALQMVENSIWTVTRSVNTRVTDFVKNLVDRGRGNRALFEVLPPQRLTLAEKGLLGSSRRAVVVCLPTSSGKTMIAQFRILQALNQFDQEQGWVAYLAPTRALVNQVTSQLRTDFEPLSVIVEKVSPALEIDSVEMDLLQERSQKQQFRVLVTTPEKLDLMLRQGWENKIGRPLTLIVVDEAHNIQMGSRGLKLELLLATINKECEKAQFLLLTPFINNAKEVARWLGGTNSDDISLTLDWQPNDRAIGIVKTVKGAPLNKRSFDYKLSFETVHTNRKTINADCEIPIPNQSEIAKTYAQASKSSEIAAIAAQFFQERGPVILMHSRIDWVWALADKLKIEENRQTNLHDDIRLLQDYLGLELGENFPLIDLLEYGIAVHHAGLPEEVRIIIEWLFQKGRLKFLVATTTIAQGINFPVSGVVMASHQFFSQNGVVDMSPEDFWNIAGRAGRISQGQLGIVALAADNEEKADKLQDFINKQTEDLNSALIRMSIEAEDKLNDLGKLVYSKPEWSSFLQYLTHSYQQMGKPSTFTQQVEQVLRGTLGFEKLKTRNSSIAQKLLNGIHKYCDDIQKVNQPLGLVDSTGFSLQSVKTILANRGGINESSWNSTTLYASDNSTLQDMMGILLRVPEIRDDLKQIIGDNNPDGNKLAEILKDWVDGSPVNKIADTHFDGDVTKCGQMLFGNLAQTASWGLSALLSITANNLDEEEKKELNNLPARAYYGVNSNEAIKIRLLGVPRLAAAELAQKLHPFIDEPISKLRKQLNGLSQTEWNQAMGERGKIYCKVWRIIEGIE